MIIKNAKLKNGIFDIETENGKIHSIGHFPQPGDIDALGKKVIPGLIDTHIHGFGGYDAEDDMLEEISCRLAEEGTTCWLPTTSTISMDRVREITHSDINKNGAVIPGFHLEGPYISPKRKGAQNEIFIKKPNLDEFNSMKNVLKITVAPEIEGMNDFIKNVSCLVSIGHTDCSYEDAVKSIDAGAKCLTHTFNAMPPLLHRAPGPIGAAIERGIYAELICDGRHVKKPAVLALYRTFGSDRLMFVSDSLKSGGMPDGKYDLGGLDVYMTDGVATLKDGTLAGGSIPLLKCVKKATEFGIDFYEAVKMASETPAKSLGLNKGQIAEGFDADLVIINDDFSVYKTIINGNEFTR